MNTKTLYSILILLALVFSWGISTATVLYNKADKKDVVEKKTFQQFAVNVNQSLLDSRATTNRNRIEILESKKTANKTDKWEDKELEGLYKERDNLLKQKEQENEKEMKLLTN